MPWAFGPAVQRIGAAALLSPRGPLRHREAQLFGRLASREAGTPGGVQCNEPASRARPDYASTFITAPWLAALLLAASRYAIISIVTAGATGGAFLAKNSTIFLSSSR